MHILIYKICCCVSQHKWFKWIILMGLIKRLHKCGMINMRTPACTGSVVKPYIIKSGRNLSMCQILSDMYVTIIVTTNHCLFNILKWSFLISWIKSTVGVTCTSLNHLILRQSKASSAFFRSYIMFLEVSIWVICIKKMNDFPVWHLIHWHLSHLLLCLCRIVNEINWNPVLAEDYKARVFHYALCCNLLAGVQQ